ncbi:hypothetical protein CBOM_02539 [Ceraceosorus bombacis]|uniref:Uncharacterized protein n=1 Tax=Ceraceosorus bombacis TaxID=401625 RepID=A0A0P1BGB2_9BASI|nr:hypothetical protein CBOM_02539 [Ceraceosorus bombacis]
MIMDANDLQSVEMLWPSDIQRWLQQIDAPQPLLRAVTYPASRFLPVALQGCVLPTDAVYAEPDTPLTSDFLLAQAVDHLILRTRRTDAQLGIAGDADMRKTLKGLIDYIGRDMASGDTAVEQQEDPNNPLPFYNTARWFTCNVQGCLKRHLAIPTGQDQTTKRHCERKATPGPALLAFRDMPLDWQRKILHHRAIECATHHKAASQVATLLQFFDWGRDPAQPLTVQPSDLTVPLAEHVHLAHAPQLE